MSWRKWKWDCYPIEIDWWLKTPNGDQKRLKWKWRSLPRSSKKVKLKVEIVTELIRFKLSLEEDCNLLLAVAFYTKQSALSEKCLSTIGIDRQRHACTLSQLSHFLRQMEIGTNHCISVQIYPPSPKILQTSQVGWMILLIWPDIKQLQICPNAFKCIYLK